MTELLERYFAGDRAKGFFVHHDNVLGLQAVKNYTHVFLASGKTIIIRRPVYICAEKLGKDFFEVRRGRWVNLEAVQEVRVHDDKRYVFLFEPGTEPVILSRLASIRLRRMSL